MSEAWHHYYTPSSIDEAIALLAKHEGNARVVGGGTDLLVEARRGLRRPFEALVDATRMAGLNEISRDGEQIVIGCGVTHTEIVTSDLVRRFGTCLAESCGVIGGPQVRNAGTLAGNIAHALPAGDGSIGLLALEGEVEVTGADGSRWIRVRDSYKGPGQSHIDRRFEILTRLRFRASEGHEGSAHHRVMRPQGLCLPIVTIAARLRVEDNIITAAGLGMGPVGPVPWPADPVVEALVGQVACDEIFVHAAEVALDNVTLRSSKYRASESYRASMIRTWLPRVLAAAARRAGGDA